MAKNPNKPKGGISRRGLLVQGPITAAASVALPPAEDAGAAEPSTFEEVLTAFNEALPHYDKGLVRGTRSLNIAAGSTIYNAAPAVSDLTAPYSSASVSTLLSAMQREEMTMPALKALLARTPDMPLRDFFDLSKAKVKEIAGEVLETEALEDLAKESGSETLSQLLQALLDRTTTQHAHHVAQVTGLDDRQIGQCFNFASSHKKMLCDLLPDKDVPALMDRHNNWVQARSMATGLGRVRSIYDEIKGLPKEQLRKILPAFEEYLYRGITAHEKVGHADAIRIAARATNFIDSYMDSAGRIKDADLNEIIGELKTLTPPDITKPMCGEAPAQEEGKEEAQEPETPKPQVTEATEPVKALASSRPTLESAQLDKDCLGLKVSIVTGTDIYGEPPFTRHYMIAPSKGVREDVLTFRVQHMANGKTIVEPDEWVKKLIHVKTGDPTLIATLDQRIEMQEMLKGEFVEPVRAR